MRINGFGSSIRLPETIKSGKTDLTASVSGSSASKGMTEEYIEKIKAYAREDAKAGVYMQEGYVALSNAQKRQYVSPNRAAAISKVSTMLNTIAKSWTTGRSILDLFGLSYTANVHKGLTRTTAEIYDQNGEMIAGYHSDNGCWTEVPTTAETNFMSESAQIYREAYRAARAEINAAAGGQTGASTAVTEGSFSITV